MTPTAFQTPWSDPTDRSLRRFLQTETGSGGILLAAAVVALVWANSPLSGAYEDLWSARLTIDIAGTGISEDLRHWVNDGLMALFFYVIGLEIRRELVTGELRDRRAAAIPIIAALAGMVAPVLIYVAINAGGPGAGGWGIVMATDIAFVLGALALLGSRVPSGVRIFLLTLAIVDDIGAIAVIAVFYSGSIDLVALAAAVAIVAAIVGLRRLREWRGPAYAVSGLALWVAVFESGVHATIAGVVLGLVTTVHPPRPSELDLAAVLGRAFRRAPSPARGRATTLQVSRAVSANERFEEAMHPWTSYLIVPLFALANAGVALDGGILGDALRSPITIGVVGGLVLGKVLGISLSSLTALRLRVGPLPPGVGRRHLPGAAALAGIGFTVSLFVAELAFDDARLRDEAKVGVLVASVVAAGLGYAWLRRTGGGDADGEQRRPAVLDPPVDPVFDEVRGPAEAARTVVMYGDYACPHSRRAAATLARLEDRLGDRLRVVFRHLPIEDEHPQGPLAAEAAQAAGAQGRFWSMHDRLMDDAHLAPDDLVAHAQALGLDAERFADELRLHIHTPRVELDVDSARRSGVLGTPTLFVDGRRHDGPYDLTTLERALS